MDIICKCGHNKKVHSFRNLGKDICMIAGKETTNDDCPCYNYIPDNLLHIEQLAKEKGLV